MTKSLLPLALAALTGASGASAEAVNCGDHSTVIASLAETWGESRQFIGLDANGTVVEAFASEETGTWTITVTRADGPTCLVASGEAFEMVAESLPIPGEGA